MESKILPRYWIFVEIFGTFLVSILGMEPSGADMRSLHSSDCLVDVQDGVRHVYSTVTIDLQTVHSELQLNQCSNEVVSHLDVYNFNRTDDFNTSIPSNNEINEQPTIFYTADFMRNIKDNMKPGTCLPCQTDRLKELGILRRFHRGSRAGRKLKSKTETITTSIVSAEVNNNNHGDSTGCHQYIPVIVTKSSLRTPRIPSPEGRKGIKEKQRINNITCGESFRNDNRVSSSIQSVSGHRLLFINATSLAKSEAFSHLQADMLSYDVDIGLVAENLVETKQASGLFVYNERIQSIAT